MGNFLTLKNLYVNVASIRNVCLNIRKHQKADIVIRFDLEESSLESNMLGLSHWQN